MVVLLIVAILVITYLLSKLSYMKHCLNDDEAVLKRHLEEFVGVLNELQRYQNFESATRDTFTRRFINECIEKYSKEAGNFEKLLGLACEEYAKKELNIATTNENV